MSIITFSKPESVPAKPTDQLEVAFAENDIDAACLKYRREKNIFVLGISIASIIAGFLLVNTDGKNVAFLGKSYLTIPETCTSRMFTGISCPGCGMTRSFLSLSKGDFAGAYSYHRFGWLMYLSIAFQIPFRIYLLKYAATGRLKSNWPRAYGYSLFLLLVFNWIYNVISNTV